MLRIPLRLGRYSLLKCQATSIIRPFPQIRSSSTSIELPTGEGIQAKDDPDTSSISPIDDEGKAPKRKTGRSKKVTIEDGELKPKKKVGRPRKIAIEDEESKPIAGDKEPKPKKKVGRPEKVTIEDAELKSEDATIEGEELKPKKKMGRPKKIASSESTEKVGRMGQPPKEVPVTEEAEGNLLE
jgi:hypothetical protein